ncbi:hypothetical protein G3I15_04110, partial [Streptomyces sp. SID10244]|nr:hypothetical protein [Streptomyces sp. SID10244]
GMRLDLEANPNVYSPEEIERHHDRIVSFVERFVLADPGREVTSIPLLADDEGPVARRFATGDAVDLGDTT